MKPSNEIDLMSHLGTLWPAQPGAEIRSVPLSSGSLARSNPRHTPAGQPSIYFIWLGYLDRGCRPLGLDYRPLDRHTPFQLCIDLCLRPQFGRIWSIGPLIFLVSLTSDALASRFFASLLLRVRSVVPPAVLDLCTSAALTPAACWSSRQGCQPWLFPLALAAGLGARPTFVVRALRGGVIGFAGGWRIRLSSSFRTHGSCQAHAGRTSL